MNDENESNQLTGNLTQGPLWANIHLGTAILCAYLPVYRPILTRVADFTANLHNRIKSLLSSRKTLKASQPTSEYPFGPVTKGLNGYEPLDDVNDRAQLQPGIRTNAFQIDSIERLDHKEHNPIQVKNNVDIV